MINAIIYRAVLSKPSVTLEDKRGNSYPSLVIKDSSCMPEGHEGSGNLNAKDIITQFMNTFVCSNKYKSENMLEILSMGIAAYVDLNKRPIIAQNIATCYCIVLVCNATGKASLCHVPDGFSQRITESADTWGKPAFEHLITTISKRLVNKSDDIIHALVVGGQEMYKADDHFALKIFVIAFYTQHLSEDDRNILATEEDPSKIRETLIEKNAKDEIRWDEEFAKTINFTPLLLNINIWTATNTLAQGGIFGGLKKNFSAGRKWAKENYPIRNARNELTPVGKIIMDNGGKDFDKNMRNLANSGAIMRRWLSDIRNVQCDRHTHLNERNLDNHTTTVGIIMESQPVVYIWTLPPENHNDINIYLNCKNSIINTPVLNTTVRENGSINLPKTEFIEFGDIQQLMDKVKHMGIFLYDENRLKLVTTNLQYESFLEKFGLEKSKVPVVGLHKIDVNKLGPAILPE